MPHDIRDEYDKMEFGAYALTDRRPFAPPGTKPKWTRTRPFDVTHVTLDLTFKRLEDRSFSGLCVELPVCLYLLAGLGAFLPQSPRLVRPAQHSRVVAPMWP